MDKINFHISYVVPEVADQVDVWVQTSIGSNPSSAGDVAGD